MRLVIVVLRLKFNLDGLVHLYEILGGYEARPEHDLAHGFKRFLLEHNVLLNAGL
jgi:hypothetical protein